MRVFKRFSRVCPRCEEKFVPNTPSHHLCIPCIDKARAEGFKKINYNKTFKLGKF